MKKMVNGASSRAERSERAPTAFLRNQKGAPCGTPHRFWLKVVCRVPLALTLAGGRPGLRVVRTSLRGPASPSPVSRAGNRGLADPFGSFLGRPCDRSRRALALRLLPGLTAERPCGASTGNHSVPCGTRPGGHPRGPEPLASALRRLPGSWALRPADHFPACGGFPNHPASNDANLIGSGAFMYSDL